MPTAMARISAATAVTRHVIHQIKRPSQRKNRPIRPRDPVLRVEDLRFRRIVLLDLVFVFGRFAADLRPPPEYRLSATKGGFRRRELLIMRPARP